MNKITKALTVAAVAVSAAYMPAANAADIPVALELALLIDVSGSVDGTEFNLQRSGYVQAFQSGAIQTAIAALTNGIAVSFWQWSSSNEQVQSVGWTHVTDAASANAFATAINGAARAFSGSTAPGSAINAAAPTFFNNGFAGPRLVIDVSGDGEENDGANTQTARNNALASGISAINGLPIGGAALKTWYDNNIVGGPNSFSIQANDFAAFANAVEQKIGREITGAPEPGTLALAGLALAGIAGLRRKQRS